MNLFDNLQIKAFNVVTNTMGYSAVWQQGGDFSSLDFSNIDFNTGSIKTAKVLYKGPTEKEKLANVDYNPDSLVMEYQTGYFTGLKESVDQNVREVVRILDVAGLWLDVTVTAVSRKWDGKTFEASITIKDFGSM